MHEEASFVLLTQLLKTALQVEIANPLTSWGWVEKNTRNMIYFKSSQCRKGNSSLVYLCCLKCLLISGICKRLIRAWKCILLHCLWYLQNGINVISYFLRLRFSLVCSHDCQR